MRHARSWAFCLCCRARRCRRSRSVTKLSTSSRTVGSAFSVAPLFERRPALVIRGLPRYGFALELLQYFAPGRAPEMLDGVADAIGAGIGACAAIALRGIARGMVDEI